MVLELGFQRLLDETLLINCLVVCALRAPCFPCDPSVMDSLFTSLHALTRRACPILVDYDLQN